MENNNQKAWEHEHQSAWESRFGSAENYALKLKQNPTTPVQTILKYMGEIKDKSILNVMGSHGNKAVALALLGAKVDVVDFSESNRQYALALAKASNVEIGYYLSDILKFENTTQYDIVFAEMGILHYFTDLNLFYKKLYGCVASGGRLIIRDFHPISTKLIKSKGSTAKVRKHKVEGDYFESSLVEKKVAYSKYLDENEEAMNQTDETVLLRYWTIGEIVTEAAIVGFRVESLIEEPNLSSDVFDKGIPKTFTLVLSK